MKKIKIYCAHCNFLLYTYNKDIRGHLIKCYKDMIVEDYTLKDLNCPSCGQEFAREAIYHNRAANKIIQGKVFTKGS
ncbi:MAG: hypothetical protein WCP14_04630 [bacterium]